MDDANCLLLILGLCFLCSGGCGSEALSSNASWAQAAIGLVLILSAAYLENKND